MTRRNLGHDAWPPFPRSAYFAFTALAPNVPRNVARIVDRICLSRESHAHPIRR
jgi:hypothetical protein